MPEIVAHAKGCKVIDDIDKPGELLRAAEERFRLAFDHAPIGMALTSAEGRWLQVNRSLSELLGYSVEEMRSMSFRDVSHPDDLAAE